jgi:hypothetical protein
MRFGQRFESLAQAERSVGLSSIQILVLEKETVR